MFWSLREKIVPFFLSRPDPTAGAVTVVVDEADPSSSVLPNRVTSGPKSVPARLPLANVSSTSWGIGSGRTAMLFIVGAGCPFELDCNPLEAAAIGGSDDMNDEEPPAGLLPAALTEVELEEAPPDDDDDDDDDEPSSLARLRYVDLLPVSSSLDGSFTG